MDIEPSFPKNSFSDIQISDISFNGMEDIGDISLGSIKGFELPDLSLDNLDIGLSSIGNLDIGLQGIDISNFSLDIGSLDLSSSEDKPSWETLSNSWSQGWSENGFSNIQNALSLTAESIDFVTSTNFGLNPFVEEAWNNSEARSAIEKWGVLELPKIADPKNSKIYLEKGQTGLQAYKQIWESQLKNTLSNLAIKAIDGLIEDGLGSIAKGFKMGIDSFLGENTISNVQNLLGLGESIFDAGKSFGEAFKSIKDGWFLVPEAGMWSGFIGGDPKNNADAKAGLNAAAQALDNIENALDSAISLLGVGDTFTPKSAVGDAAAAAASAAGGGGSEWEATSEKADMEIAKLSKSATYSPVKATSDTKKTFQKVKIKDTLKDRSEGKDFDEVICRILKSKDVMSNMYDVIFTFGDPVKVNFDLPNIDPFLLSARVTGISIPGEEQASFPTKFCGSNIDRVDNQVNYSHQSSFDILADESLYYIQYFNKLAQVDNSLDSDWGKLTLEALEDALQGEKPAISMAELPSVLSKGKIDLYVRRGFPDSYRFWKFENIRILGPGAGIGFKREGASTMSLSYEFIFKNCYEVNKYKASTVFKK